MLEFFNSHLDKFIVVGSTEVSLFELKEKDHETDFIYDTPKLQNISNFGSFDSYQTAFLRICLFFAGNLKFISQLDNSLNFLSSEKRYQYIKCAAPSHHNDELLVACGTGSGKVSIINFLPASENYLEFSEFACNAAPGKLF